MEKGFARFATKEIQTDSIVDGEGIRSVIWFQGCSHNCPGCHNPQTWNVLNGEYCSQVDIYVKAMDSPFNVTFSGGDPMLQASELYEVYKHLSKHKNIWVYTGYTWEEIMEDPFKYTLLTTIDVLVDGKFVEELANPDLKFRGSSNQRIIDVKKSLANRKVITMEV